MHDKDISNKMKIHCRPKYIFFYIKNKLSDIQFLIDIQSFNLSCVLTKNYVPTKKTFHQFFPLKLRNNKMNQSNRHQKISKSQTFERQIHDTNIIKLSLSIHIC